jgi:hypothetical protein
MTHLLVPSPIYSLSCFFSHHSHDTFTRQVLRQIRNATPSSSLGTSVNPLDKAAQKPGYGSNKSGQGKKAIGKSTTESCFNSS